MPGEWHNKMESRFPAETREVKFFCSNKNTSTCRRADILLSTKRTVEIQHSRISNDEIISRFNDWNKFGKEIIWLVDGNEQVNCYQLTNGNYLIHFITAWRYKSFLNIYKYILLDIGDKVFRIDLQKVRCKMIEVSEFKPINEIIDELITNSDNIWNNWTDYDAIDKCMLTVHQQGAGNGKTYGIWKSIANNTDKKTYVIVTKQHSAKVVIYNELLDQECRKEYHIENLTGKMEENTTKHFVIKYTHKISKKECIVIIGTVDSFIYNAGRPSNDGGDLFQNILQNISKNGATNVNQYGSMNFGGQTISINKECEIWIDEAQDLSQDYLHAFTRLMRDTLCDIHIVGDKLQSLENDDNFFATIVNDGIDGLPNIHVDIHPAFNINRRIKIAEMDKQINKLVHFSEYSLPSIEINANLPIIGEKQPIEIISEPELHDGTSQADIQNKLNYINLLIKIVDYEVNANIYVPENFMFVFPIMKSNHLATELVTKLQEYWTNKFMDETYREKITDEYWKTVNHTEQYIQYAILHKHQEGTCINTNDSIHATRLVSIRTSKGDGREVVFVLDTNEKNLKLISNGSNLVYESHFHVALTRAKNQIYIGLKSNNDDMHKRFNVIENVGYLSNCSARNKVNDIIFRNKLEFSSILEQNNINHQTVLTALTNNKQTNNLNEQVDWGYHCIKYCVYFFKFILGIVQNKDSNSDYNQSHLSVILNHISNISLVRYEVNEYYEFIHKHCFCKKSCCKKGLFHFPVCFYSKKNMYSTYYKIIYDAMVKVQTNIRNNTLNNLSVYESIILTYMILVYIDLCSTDINPNDLYNITHFFQESNGSKEKHLLDSIQRTESLTQEILHDITDNVKWNIQKQISFDGKTTDFYISTNHPIIGYSENHIFHIMLKTDITKLNFWDVMTEVLYQRFLLFNSCRDEDKNKYDGKPITTYLVLLNQNDYIKIDWNWDNGLHKELCIFSQKAFFVRYDTIHRELFTYLNYVKNIDNKDKLWGDNCTLDDSNKKKQYATTPFKYIKLITELRKFPEYIISFFGDMHDKWIDGLINDVKHIYSNIDIFTNALQERLKTSSDKYFGLNKSNINLDF